MTRSKQTAGFFMILGAAVIWGAAFSAQSIGADAVDPCTFLAVRSWIAVLSMIPLILGLNRRNGKIYDTSYKKPKMSRLWAGGAICGSFLCAASAAQQIGIAYTTVAKSGFITALYIVIIPVIYLIFGRKTSRKLWLSIGLSVTGLFLLCMNGTFSLSFGDAVILLSAFLFAGQIISVDHYVFWIHPIRLSMVEFFVEAVLATVLMLIWGRPDIHGIIKALPALLYVGIFSSAVAYTLQAAGQKNLNPTLASLLMSMESVFSAIFGWIILGEGLNARELLGCILMFAAIITAQLPLGEMIRKVRRFCRN